MAAAPGESSRAEENPGMTTVTGQEEQGQDGAEGSSVTADAVGSTQAEEDEQEQDMKRIELPFSVDSMLQSLLQRYQKYQQQKQNPNNNSTTSFAAIAVGLLSMLFMLTNRSFVTWWLKSLWTVTLNCVGVALGVGLGLGLATHVYDLLTSLQERQDYHTVMSSTATTNASNSNTTTNMASPSTRFLLQRQTTANTAALTSAVTINVADDQTTYASLMKSAGYYTPRGGGNATGIGIGTNSNSNNVLRGQVLRRDDAFFQSNYKDPFVGAVLEDGSPSLSGRALQLMQEYWPVLPLRVNEQLARLQEYVIRDYITGWYSMVDYGCEYKEAATATTKTTVGSGGSEETESNQEAAGSDSEKAKDGTSSKQLSLSASSSFLDKKKRMIYSTARHVPLPFLERTYESMALAFGCLATRTEHINVLELLLLKWTRILAHTFKVYRSLRRKGIPQLSQPNNTNPHPSPSSSNTASSSAASNNNNATNSSTSLLNHTTATASTPVSGAIPVDHLRQKANTKSNNNNNNNTISSKKIEMLMTKEFLFAGKLHRAVTFGLDVPSLLFADGAGRECGRPPTAAAKNCSTGGDATGTAAGAGAGTTANNNNILDDDVLLEERLFQTPILAECELDYNRVLAHRMLRALLPRNDWNSGIVSSLLTEMVAGCVLSPLMSCFCPEYLNSWIIQGLEVKKEDEQPEATSTTAASAGGVSPSGTATTKEEKERRRKSLSSVVAQDVLQSIPEEKSASSNGEDKMAAATRSTLPPASQADQDAPPSPTVTITTASTASTTMASTKTANAPPADDSLLPQQQHQQKQALVANEMSPPTSPSAKTLTTAAVTSTSPLLSPRPTLLSYDLSPKGTSGKKAGEDIITLLAMALIELQQFVDFDEIRQQQQQQEGEFHQAPSNINAVDWDNSGCREAILRLVLVIEAALTNGRCTYKIPTKKSLVVDDDDDVGEGEDEDGVEGEEDDDEDVDGSEGSVEVTLPEYESTTLSQILMEMTSDIEAFEERVATENILIAEGKIDTERYKDVYAQDYTRTPTEQSTLRTLIAAWLHTGQIYRTVTVLVQAHMTVLAPYYHSKAFLRNTANANGFVRQLKALEGVEVLVDTMAVLSCPRLDETSAEELNDLVRKSALAGTQPTSLGRQQQRPSESLSPRIDVGSPSSSLTTAQFNMSTSTPRFLDFHRNEAFASSLRSERERRLQSWHAISREDPGEEGLPIIHRSKGCTENDFALHIELHHIARIFYSGTNLVAIRDAARHKTQDGGGGGGSVSEASELTDIAPPVQVSLLTIETASQRRRIEVPDDDSSFLLRAQPRALNAVGVHRDQRNHDQSFKCYAATYEQAALNSKSEHYSGGRYIRRCLVRYYPIDRTASVSLQASDARKLDQRRGRPAVPDTITLGQSSRAAPCLSSEFLRERHLCQRWVPRGTTRSQSILASSVMEPTDFNSMPRTGKAIEFVYRMSFFERPMIDLGGKHFTVQDSASLGTHRADASSLEISDATLSVALLMLGTKDTEQQDDASEFPKNTVEMGPDGYPIIWMKFSRKEDDAQVEVKPYRLSFVRAALLITAARHEAQLQSLVACVRSGSAKNATKALTDSRLLPTVRLLEYAGNRSREKQSILLRDLKLTFHIDREQLRRNGLLSPRYPTVLLDLGATVEDDVIAEEVQGVELFGATGTLFKVRCTAVVDIVAEDSELVGDPSYSAGDGTVFRTVREEWVVYRSFKDIQNLHKHLKMQVSASESSGTAGSRIVGAAVAAAFAAGNVLPGRSRQRRGSLIPSLSQASKAGALGVTKKSSARRKEALDAYLKYFLSPGHFLNRCSEILLFLGASFPLPPEVRPGLVVSGISDPLGRTEMTRTVIATRADGKKVDNAEEPTEVSRSQKSVRAASMTASPSMDSQDEEQQEDFEKTDHQLRKSRRDSVTIPAIQNKIVKVPLSQVRNRVFELLRYQFGFENAGFVRNRMLAALKTVSFAVTTNAEFQRTLYKIHSEQISAESVAGWIEFGLDMLWPDGVFFESSPPTSPEQLEADSKRARKVLHESFPEQFRAVLGQDLTRDGLNIFSEMLQNRLVVKSMAYMLFDLLWLEIFPEIGDVLECGAVLDILDP